MELRRTDECIFSSFPFWVSFEMVDHTVRLTSIYLPQNGYKFAMTPGAQTIKFYGSLISELVLPTIKFGMAPLEVGPEFAANF
jgi:hypothetical protein